MRAAITRAPSGAQDRLARARRALKAAEERAGLHHPGALEVQRAMSSGSFASPVSSVPVGAPAGSPAASLTALVASPDSGVLSLQGSATLLLVILALRQGSSGWCGVIGGDDLGWCTATEVGLDLNRVLSVPASTLDDASAGEAKPLPGIYPYLHQYVPKDCTFNTVAREDADKLLDVEHAEFEATNHWINTDEVAVSAQCNLVILMATVSHS